MSKMVILDPGHGGKDSGAVGLGHKEKDDALKLAKAVGALIEPHITVVYTRTTDRYDSPSEKAQIANKYPNAELFVSIHRNDYNTKSNGFEVDLRGNTGVKKKYADYVRKKMANEIGFVDRGTVQRENLAVLNKTIMPAVLNEVGFMKNKRDTELFETKFNEIAQVIADGILYTLDVEKTDKKTDTPPYKAIRKSSGKTKIKWLQKKLNANVQQILDGKMPKLAVDGIWGVKTQNVLYAYWAQLGWKKGSYAGEKTCRALYKNRKK